MSVESRSPLRGLRRPKKEQDRPDYSEPDFGSWSAKLDSYIPAAHAAAAVAPATVAVAQAPLAAAPDLVLAAALAAAPAPTAAQPVFVEQPVEQPVALVQPVAVAKRAASSSSLTEALAKLLSFDGAMGVAVVDSETGMILGRAGAGIEMDLPAAGASVMLRARLASMKALGSTEKLDDMLISLSTQVQIIHPLPTNPKIFTYLIGDKSKSSLAMARYKATEADLLLRL